MSQNSAASQSSAGPSSVCPLNSAGPQRSASPSSTGPLNGAGLLQDPYRARIFLTVQRVGANCWLARDRLATVQRDGFLR